MGCASSNPLIDSGKKLINNVKESTSDFANKGEHVIEETTETAKEKIVSGVGNIKDAVGGALENAENNIESVVGKFGNTFNTFKHEVSDEMNELTDTSSQLKNNLVDNGVEVLSEADTVLMSETENVKDEMHNNEDMAFEKVNTETENAETPKFNDTLQLEDLEQSWEADETKTNKIEDKIEKDIEDTSPSPENEDKTEELPTYWEVRADAILEERMKSFDKDSMDDGSYEETTFEFNNKNEDVAEDHRTQNYNHLEQETEHDDYQFNNIIIVTEH